MNRLRPALLAALLATGCIPDTGKLDPYRSAEAFCPVLYDLLAAKVFDCGGAAPYLEPTFYANLLQFCDAITAGEKAGRIGFDKTRAEAAVASIQAAGCSTIGLPDNVIPFIPLVGVGGACLSSLDCTTASAGCFSPSLTCPGHCLAPTTTAGVTCDSSGLSPPCGDAFYCSTSGGSSTCQPRVGTGGNGCATGSPPCKASDYCDAVAVPSICNPKGAAGAPCGSDSQCDDRINAHCNTTLAKCYIANVAATAGQSCAYPNECASGFWCNGSSVCQLPLNIGEVCTSNSACGQTGAGCVADSTATAAVSHCRAKLTEGATCIVGINGCQDGLYCSGSVAGGAGTCLRSPTVGHDCGTILGERVRCLDGWCNHPANPTPGGPPLPQGTCTAPAKAGEPCPNRVECGTETSKIDQLSCLDVTGTAMGSGYMCVARCFAVAAGSFGTTF